MTFAQYVQNLGALLITWLPICLLMYLAVRWGIIHGSVVALAQLDKMAERAELSDAERDKISRP